jgi:hypothetical protein
MAARGLGPYRILRRLAAGGMAEVFVADRLGPHGFAKRVALKRILPQHARDPEFVGMFIDEARLAARLAHPNIVGVFDFGEHAGSLFMAMELVEGTTVGRLLRTVASHGEAVALAPALHVAREAANALAYAHDLRDDEGQALHIVHRDVSPANLLLTGRGHVKLTDFGIARCRTTAQRTDEGHIRGKLGYMSPEQVVGDRVASPSDVFTLGVVLTEMLIAEPLFAANADLDVLIQIRNVDLAVLDRSGSHLPKDVRRLLEWAMSRDPKARPTAGMFARAITEVLQRRGELGSGALDLARLLQRLELVPREPLDAAAKEPGARPTLFIDMGDAKPPTEETRTLLEDLDDAPRTTYELRHPGGRLEGPLPFSEVVRRIVCGDLPGAVDIRRDGGDFESAGRVPELRRYVESPALRWGPEGAPKGTARRGFLYGGRLLAQVYRMTADRETGALHLWDGERRKKIYYVDGRPEFVASNRPDELLGEFLVRRGYILRMELDMALAMMPRYEGRLGDTLVGLGVLRPVELYRAVAEQVRERFLEAFRWNHGQWAYVRGARCEEETFPLPAAEHELLRDAALEASPEQLDLMLRPLERKPLSRNPKARAPISAYRVRDAWERVLDAVDGRSVEDLRVRDVSPEEVRRALYFGLSCGLVKAA